MVKPTNRTCCAVVLDKCQSSISRKVSTMFAKTVDKHSPEWTHRRISMRNSFYIVMYKGPHCSVLGFIIAHSLSNASVVKSENFKGNKLYGKVSCHNSLALQVFGDSPVKTISICTTILYHLRNINTTKIVLIRLVNLEFGLLQLQTKMCACSNLIFYIKRFHQDNL